MIGNPHSYGYYYPRSSPYYDLLLRAWGQDYLYGLDLPRGGLWARSCLSQADLEARLRDLPVTKIKKSPGATPAQPSTRTALTAPLDDAPW